jgi:hypothetical protein
VENAAGVKIRPLNQDCALWKTSPETASFLRRAFSFVVMPANAGIHVLLLAAKTKNARMPGTRLGMTKMDSSLRAQLGEAIQFLLDRHAAWGGSR